ncbi:MAG TPA: hypothetical protein VEC35_22915 [Noviherbaspirillum sp.]|nr:hypothetical protein [Noviherbaspirillum sp.]
MHTRLANILLLLLAFTVAIPESFAKRAGSGRSGGRQSSAVVRPKPAPPPQATPAPVQRPQPATPPTAARQDQPPSAPERAIPQQARSPWGGFLGGALLGLGLGSLLGDRDRDQDAVNQSVGESGTGAAASGAGEDEAVGQNREGRGGALWGLGILALVAIYLLRRARGRGRRH